MREGLDMTVEDFAATQVAATDDLDFGPATGLICRECSANYGLGAAYACMECFGPLEVKYDYGHITRESIEAGPNSLWRYSALLPVSANAVNEPNLAPGCTRLVHAHNLAEELGMTKLWVKDDAATPPTRSRIASSRGAGVQRVGDRLHDRWRARQPATWPTRSRQPPPGPVCARAYSSRATSRPARQSRRRSTAATLVAVEGNYDDVNRSARSCRRPGDDEWGFVNVNLRPYYAEGSKTWATRVAEQLGWRLPAQVVDPDCFRRADDQGGQGFPRVDHPWAWWRTRLQDLRRSGHGLLAGRDGV